MDGLSFMFEWASGTGKSLVIGYSWTWMQRLIEPKPHLYVL